MPLLVMKGWLTMEIKFRADLSTLVCMQFDIKNAYLGFQRSLTGNETEEEMFCKDDFEVWQNLVIELFIEFGLDEKLAQKIVMESAITDHWHKATVEQIEMDLRYLARHSAENIEVR